MNQLDQSALIILTLCALILLARWFLGRKLEKATLLEVLDGDSIVVKTTKHTKGVKVRLGGIDCPEKASNMFQKNEAFANRAADFVEKKLPPNSELFLEFDHVKWDEFGRLLAYVFIDPGKSSINAQLLKKGYARLQKHSRNTKYQREFERLERKAQRYKLGIWKYSKNA